jgi:hypothetical protein
VLAALLEPPIDEQDHRGAMPRPVETTFGDLLGKLDMLVVECPRCGRAARYPLHRLIDRRGRDLRILDCLDELTADCPRKQSASISDQCHARCPDLPKVL